MRQMLMVVDFRGEGVKMTFGQMIRNERIRRGLTIQTLADNMGVGNSYIRQYECEALTME